MEKHKTVVASPLAPHPRLAGKVAIITGGASGIGESTVKLFHKNGAKVVISDIQDDLGRQITEKLGGDNVCYIHCDVRNEDEISNLVDSTRAKYGKVDIFCNTAGIRSSHNDTILDSQKTEVDTLFSVNLVGAFLGAKHAARIMIPQSRGCILFAAHDCSETGGIPAAAAARYGILGLAKNLAAEIGQYGIRVNCVSASGLGKNMCNPTGEIVCEDDVAKAALYLASDEANYVSGLNLVVDGGLHSGQDTSALLMSGVVGGVLSL